MDLPLLVQGNASPTENEIATEEIDETEEEEVDALSPLEDHLVEIESSKNGITLGGEDIFLQRNVDRKEEVSWRE